MLRPAQRSIVARPKRKPADSDRKRINLSFNMGVHSEAAAYETLKKLSQSRKATEFITSLVIQYLADEAKGTETGETHPINRQAFAAPTQTTVMPAMPKADDAIQKPKQVVEVPQVKNEPAEETHTAVVEENTAVDADDGVSQESIADVMAIFGY